MTSSTQHVTLIIGSVRTGVTLRITHGTCWLPLGGHDWERQCGFHRAIEWLYNECMTNLVYCPVTHWIEWQDPTTLRFSDMWQDDFTMHSGKSPLTLMSLKRQGVSNYHNMTIQTNNNKHIKLPHFWPFIMGFHGLLVDFISRFPSQKNSNAEIVLMPWRNHDIHGSHWVLLIVFHYTSRMWDKWIALPPPRSSKSWAVPRGGFVVACLWIPNRLWT